MSALRRGVLRDLRLLPCLIGDHARPALPRSGPDGALAVDLVIEDGRIADLLPARSAPAELDVLHDHRGGLVFPKPVDIHTHLDKTLIWERCENPDGSFAGAIAAVSADREANWTREDVESRIEAALHRAHAHGTAAIRTHLDTFGGHGERVWPLFGEIQRRWAGRIALQATALVTLDRYLSDDAEALARTVAATEGGQLGVVIMADSVSEDGLCAMFALAERFVCDLDLHVDENGMVGATALEAVARTAIARRFRGRILCGHCCALSRQTVAERDRIIALVSEAGIGIVSLPGCNLYLQDRASGRTPQWRGVAPLHELAAAGVPVMVASDNVRDPFYAYGDYDLFGVFADAVRITHLDTPFGDWPRIFTLTPAAWMGHDIAIARGRPASVVLPEARSLNELVSRPSVPRRVFDPARGLAPNPGSG